MTAAAKASAPAEFDLRYAWRALSVVAMASTLTSLNQSTLSIALPEVVRAFDASSLAASWIVLIFGLTSTCVTLACGRLADVVARRSMYLAGLGIFTVSCLLLGFAPNVPILIGLQVVQAIAESMLLANSAVIVSSVFPPAMLGRALGIYMAGFSVASLLGPSIGGALVTGFGWQWLFWFNVPLGAVCFVCGALTLRKMPAGRSFTGIDLRGNVLLIAGLGGLIAALSAVSTSGWGSRIVQVGFGLAVVFLPLFVWLQRRTDDPLLDVTVFRNRPFSLAVVAGLINAVATSAVVILVALYLQAIKGASALDAGLQLLPLAGAKVVASVLVGVLTKRMSNESAAAVGAAITTAGLLLLLGGTWVLGSFAPILVALIVVGLGSGIFAPANAAATLDGVVYEDLGRINAVRLTVQNSAWVVGTALGLTLLTAPLSGTLQRAVFAGKAHLLGQDAVDQLLIGFSLALAVMSALSALAIVASQVSRRYAAGDGSGVGANSPPVRTEPRLVDD